MLSLETAAKFKGAGVDIRLDDGDLKRILDEIEARKQGVIFLSSGAGIAKWSCTIGAYGNFYAASPEEAAALALLWILEQEGK